MNDTYVEILVKKPEQKLFEMLSGLLMGVGIICIMIGLATNVLITISGLLLELIAYLLKLNCKIEYEYLYLDKELSIDMIKNQAKRKKLVKYSVSTLQVMAPSDSARLEQYAQQKVKDFSAETEGFTSYDAIFEGKEGLERVLLNANEEYLNAMRMCAPRAIFHD